MQIEQEIFRQMKPDPDALRAYGFRTSAEGHNYSETFLEGQFRADIRITEEGMVHGQVIDLESGEEYAAVHMRSRRGAYVAQVRAAYETVLQNIADACFIREPYLYPQTQRIVNYFAETYSEPPDHPFTKWPAYSVLRNPENRKWYGIIMPLRRSALTGDSEADADTDPIVEVLNVKVVPETIPSLLQQTGIFPVYHMNRKHWVSIVLNDSVPDAEIIRLLEVSRGFGMRKCFKKGEIS